MSFVADTHNNPFHVDGETLPPQRSAFAVLDVDRQALRTTTVGEAYEEARRKLAEAPELAGVYGRPLHADDLRLASARLDDPRGRVVNELLDFKVDPLDLDEVEELTELMDGFRSALASEATPVLDDPSLMARLLGRKIEFPGLDSEADPRLGRPDLPPLEDLVSGIL